MYLVYGYIKLKNSQNLQYNNARPRTTNNSTKFEVYRVLLKYFTKDQIDSIIHSRSTSNPTFVCAPTLSWNDSAIEEWEGTVINPIGMNNSFDWVNPNKKRKIHLDNTHSRWIVGVSKRQRRDRKIRSTIQQLNRMKPLVHTLPQRIEEMGH